MVGYSFTYYKKVRNPLVRRLAELGALSAESATTVETILESDRVSRAAVNQFLQLGYISTSETGELYLNVPKIRKMARLTGLLLFLVTEGFLVILVLLMAFGPTVVDIPPFLDWSMLIVGTIPILLLTYLEGWPFFYLRHSVK